MYCSPCAHAFQCVRRAKRAHTHCSGATPGSLLENARMAVKLGCLTAVVTTPAQTTSKKLIIVPRRVCKRRFLSQDLGLVSRRRALSSKLAPTCQVVVFANLRIRQHATTREVLNILATTWLTTPPWMSTASSATTVPREATQLKRPPSPAWPALRAPTPVLQAPTLSTPAIPAARAHILRAREPAPVLLVPPILGIAHQQARPNPTARATLDIPTLGL
mmetsp:Transcript_79537/g.128874  ORF Transcript_79537/g.128874 Transcript_79537/m.128874 type:complete len:219 (+) Transcript_79537:413-1069(+)